MIVNELIEILKQFDGNLEVKTEYDGMYYEVKNDDVYLIEDEKPIVIIF